MKSTDATATGTISGKSYELRAMALAFKTTSNLRPSKHPDGGPVKLSSPNANGAGIGCFLGNQLQQRRSHLLKHRYHSPTLQA